MTKARDISKLLSTANGKIAGENLDVSFENITDTGTEGTKVASGTSAQRGSTAGQLRFNSTTGLAEYYTGTAFKSIDSPPTVSSLDVTEVDSQAGGNQTIVITGSGFNSGATVTFVGNAGTDFNASTVTVDSDTQITTVAPKASFLNAQEPYGVKVTNVSGLSATLASQINVDTSPSWSTASGSLGSIYEDATGNHFTVSATDADGDTVSYSLQSGSLGGLSLNSSTGVISGDPTDVASSTTLTFTLRATANSKTSDRSFNIVVNPAPIITSLLMVAGGGGGGTNSGEGGGGGAGGLVYYGSETPKTPNGSAISLIKGTTYTATIGQGGSGATSYGANGGNGTSGGNSTFTGSGLSLITALGGGTGGNYPGGGTNFGDGVAGGSGGGGGGNSASGGSQLGGAGTAGQGFAGGNGYYNSGASSLLAGGGGGASEAGETPSGGSTKSGDGGDGLAYSITGTSVYYAGGGSGNASNGTIGSGGLGGGGAGSGTSGTNGLGGGGGGASGNGGSGVIILRLPTADYTGTTTGSPTVTTDGSDTIIKFTSNGTYTA